MVEQRQMAVSRVAGPARPGPAPAVALTPKEVVGILRRHVLLIISLTILGLISGAVAWYLLLKYAPKYTARTLIEVLPPAERDPMTIAGAVMHKDIMYGYRASMAALITQQRTLEKLLERDKIQETAWFKSFGNIEYERHQCIRKAFKSLTKNFKAFPDRDRDFIFLSMTCGDKKEAATIVNEMVDLFLKGQVTDTRTDISRRLAELQNRRDAVDTELAGAQARLDEIRRTTGITDLEEGRGRYFQHTITLRLNQLELEQNDLLLAIDQARADINNLERLAVGPITVQIENVIERDPVMVSLAQQLAFQETVLAGRLTKFGEGHRVVRQAQDLIDEIKQRRELRKIEIAEQTRQAILRNAQDRLAVLQSRYEQLGLLREEAEAKQRDLDEARSQYQQWVTVKEERIEMLAAIKEQLEKLRIMYDDPKTPKVQFAGYAPEPLEVSSPMYYFYFPGGTMLGFMCGIGLAFLIELLNDLVRTPRDVVRYLHIPLLGIIPDASEDRQARDVDLSHVIRQAPYSFISESYRRFRTNLKLSASGESSKVLLVTSGAAGDGKTSVAVNLATTLVAENKKVLLVDANFRRPSLYKTFPKAGGGDAGDDRSECGLSTVLSGLCGYQDAIRPSGVEGLWLVDSGQLPSNPAELLDSPQMTELVTQQRENYDYVIVDGPPLLLLSDAKVLARAVDATILVFNAGATRRGAAQRAIRELREVNATLAGCVLFAVKAMKGGYFQEQVRSYQKYQPLQAATST